MNDLTAFYTFEVRVPCKRCHGGTEMASGTNFHILIQDKRNMLNSSQH
jgi:hypothetical protein